MDSGNRFELTEIITELENLHDRLEDIYYNEEEDQIRAEIIENREDVF